MGEIAKIEMRVGKYFEEAMEKQKGMVERCRNPQIGGLEVRKGESVEQIAQKVREKRKEYLEEVEKRSTLVKSLGQLSKNLKSGT